VLERQVTLLSLHAVVEDLALGANMALRRWATMKLKDITDWPEGWSTPLGTIDANAPVADGVLVDLSLWGMIIIGLWSKGQLAENR
jgi:hypothetical protein